ncbi:bacterial alpha-L-rhamnosidase-domain-containing protein [Aspergillus venezuelensis]
MTGQISLAKPTVEQHPTGLGVGTPTPRLSWRFLSAKDYPRNWQQSAYEIQITRTSDSEPETYSVNSDSSLLVPWPSTPLKSRESAHLRVRAFGRGDGQAKVEATDWSPWTVAECALLSRDDWIAKPITEVTNPIEDEPLRPIRFRKSFDLPGKGAIAQARLYITSLGIYRAFINGREVSDHVLAPGWTSYRYRLNYQTLDVAPFMNHEGANTIAIEVAEGWYATRLGFKGGRRKLYGDRIAAIGQLEVRFEAHAEPFSLVTDRTWTCQPSAIVKSEYYDGEVYDAREENPLWNCTIPEGTTDASRWNQVEELPFPTATLIAPDSPPVRVTETIKPISVQQTPSGKTILDFGQNLVGRLLIKSINKASGSRLIFTHAEVLEHGELGTRPLRIAKCTDEVICSGSQLTDWSPQYTFHGFRYVQVDGWDEGHDGSLLDNVTASVMHTDMTRTGWFACSHPMINKLHDNALWSMKGNFVSIPTDCPQRDERLGWTGDIQIFGPSANFLYNTAGMLGEWLQDVAAEQLNDGKNGAVPPFVVPNVITDELWPPTPQAQWDDVVILGPWKLYQSFGDVETLRHQYKSMLAWIDIGIQRGPDRLWDPSVWQLGDWLDPTAPPVEPGDARTNGTLVADAFLVHLTSAMSEISTVLGETADADRFTKDADRLKGTFQDRYIAKSGLLVGDSQTALSLAIMFDLHATSDQKDAAATRLVDLVRLAQFRVATGFAGTPIITHALTKGGHPDMAYRMLLEKRCPSWMYPVTMGATTMWERWDSMLPDGSINPGEMTSFNHYAFGSIINWLHTTVAGVSPISPGWKKIRVKPIPGGNLENAEVVYETPYGRLECRWVISAEKNTFTLELLVPPNSRALVTLPRETYSSVSEEREGTWVGSGRYNFSVPFDWEKFSSNAYFEGVPPWQRAQKWFKAAMQSFNARKELINLASLQGCILLSFVALAEGDSAQEALLTSQAICMVRMLRLPENLSSDPIQREVEIRIYWGMWMTENWHAARALIPKQLTASPDFKRPLEEETFRNMKPTDATDLYSEERIASLKLRDCGLWSWMLALSGFHDEAMRLNDEIVQNTASEHDSRRRVCEISQRINDYFRSLPGYLQHTAENRERYFSRGLGREFTILQINFHHQCQMLYYQFLNRKPVSPDGGTDYEAVMYAARCKAHATALSEVMWDTNSRPGNECLWSPVNGHLVVVASSVLIYALLFDSDDESISRAKKLLEQNFIMLLQFRKYWSLVELSMARLRAFHRACQMNATQESFDMDRWMIYFLNRYDVHVSERYSDGVYGSITNDLNSATPDSDLWLELSNKISTTSAPSVNNMSPE